MCLKYDLTQLSLIYMYIVVFGGVIQPLEM